MFADITMAEMALLVGALAVGGVLKGATGAGVPVVAVPVMAALFDVKLAVAIMVTPNLVTNFWQMWQFRGHRLDGGFSWKYAAAGALGAVLGTVLLASLPGAVLMLGVAGAVLMYVALRLLKPGMRLALGTAQRLVWPVGTAAGMLQGAAGISAPISVSFLNAMRLERPVFIHTISVFFTVMSVAQLPALYAYGLITPALMGLGLATLLPVVVTIPLGAWLAQRLSPAAFDKVVLVLLSGLALRLIWDALV